MWLAIVGIIDKILGMFSDLVPFWIKRSDEAKKQRDEARKGMDEAVQKGDNDAYWNARAKRFRS